jgi:hypothetical protein
MIFRNIRDVMRRAAGTKRMGRMWMCAAGGALGNHVAIEEQGIY